jgi:hypothetical protein
MLILKKTFGKMANMVDERRGQGIPIVREVFQKKGKRSGLLKADPCA